MRRHDQRPEVEMPPRWRFSKPRGGWLDNGMQLVLCHRRDQHVASVCLSFDLPLNAEPAQAEGVATITQRCLDEGTEQHPGADFAESLEDIGAVMDGSVGFSASQLFLDVPVNRLPEALVLMAEAVRTPQLREEDIERHRELCLAEIELSQASSARSAQLAFRRACIPGRFRASRMAGGSSATVLSVSADQVRSFHARHYRPENATLIITADLSSDIYPAVAAAFGSWLVAGTAHETHQTPGPRRPHRWLIDRPGAVQADIRLGRFGIDRADPRWADARVATRAVGGAFLSRLNRVLREEKGFTYGVQLVNQPLRDGGLLSVQGSFRTEVVAQAVTIAATLVDLTGSPLSETEVAEAVNYFAGSSPLRYSTAQGVTQHLAALCAAGLTSEFINASSLALDQVTPDSATAALSELLPHGQLSLVVVGDAAKLSLPLAEAGWPTSQPRL